MNPKYNNPLDSVWRMYETTKGCFKVTKRAHAKKDIALLSKTTLILDNYQLDTQLIKSSEEELHNLLILTLWATFERCLIEYLQEKGAVLGSTRPLSLAPNLQDKYDLSVESWKQDDILKLFKDIVNENLRGYVLNIKKRRDYIAHRNPRWADAPKTDPTTAYKILSKFLLVIRSETQ